MSRYEISNSDDVIDIRDVIARISELKARDRMGAATMGELQSLEALLENCRCNGSDYQHKGDWFPITLIRDSYFKSHAKKLAEDPKVSWPNNCINWEFAVCELRMEHTPVDFDGVTYWA